MATGSKKVIYAALVGNALIAVTKFIAAGMTGSSAMLSEGIHSVVDTGNQVLLLWGIRQSQKPADRDFPFGHGKEVYFWSFVVAILIFAVGAGISIYEGISHLKHPEPMTSVHINYIVLALAIVFEGFAFTIAYKEFSKVKGELGYLEAVRVGKDPTTFVVLFEDSAAMAGLVVAFIGIALTQITGNLYFDGIASIIIGLILGATAVWLAYETKGLLIGEAAAPQVVQGIENLVRSHRTIKHINETLTMHMGPDNVLVNLSVDFVDAISSSEVESTVTRLDEQIKAAFPNVKRVFIEAERWSAKNLAIGAPHRA